jgi:hypothetical protein
VDDIQRRKCSWPDISAVLPSNPECTLASGHVLS